MERGILTGLVAFRWAAWVWMATVLVIGFDDLEHPAVAVVLVLAALVMTATLTALLRQRPTALLAPPLVAFEVALGAALLMADGYVYGAGHAFSSSQSLGVGWPLGGVLAAGALVGPVCGTAAGVTMAVARLVGAELNGVALGALSGEQVLSLLSSAVLYGLAGGVGGYAVGLLRKADRQISSAEAREEMARHLHDGVLQTLAVVGRRTDDPTLARLVRDQERELRAFVAGLAGEARSLEARLGRAADRFERTYGGRVDLVLAEDLPALTAQQIDALAGAVGEALTNAGKHGGAQKVTVYAEPVDDGVFCSVMDDGAGFDPSAVSTGTGIAHSIRNRITDAGGRVEVVSAPGEGAEVQLWLR